MTEGEWDAEEYQQQRRSRSWWSCSTTLGVFVVLLVRLVRR